ncbi:MAG: dihydropteroate synthase [Dietzia sp.]|nr:MULTISPECIES: dihydropteroate synthase [Dietzia]MBB1048706.1 dihydropteroate synthase [Dietzia cercidiphylli]MBC7296396.1 dihydropteroate synthase [Dietzia sp.]MCT1515344.1 dihydropteroate synthase [Dietzia cercidiphylli]MDO8393668.1 dihydropteroate synthase [Dietzia sp.]
MGIVNVTEDSFSDGGRHLAPEAALAHARRLVSEGADLLDVGGESTRPGAIRVDRTDEAARVIPLVRALVEEEVTVSVDTMRASVAAEALDSGAALINDVSGGLADPGMLEVVADHGCPVVLMHWVSPDQYRAGAGGRADYGGDVVTSVRDHLARRADAAVSAGVDAGSIVVDPGLGFAKDAADNWALLHRLDVLIDLGFPVLVAASRKRFLGSLLADTAGVPRAVADRDPATAAVTALAAAAGAWAVRVHDVPPSADAVRVTAAWAAGGVEEG